MRAASAGGFLTSYLIGWNQVLMFGRAVCKTLDVFFKKRWKNQKFGFYGAIISSVIHLERSLLCNVGEFFIWEGSFWDKSIFRKWSKNKKLNCIFFDKNGAIRLWSCFWFNSWPQIWEGNYQIISKKSVQKFLAHIFQRLYKVRYIGKRHGNSAGWQGNRRFFYWNNFF